MSKSSGPAFWQPFWGSRPCVNGVLSKRERHPPGIIAAKYDAEWMTRSSRFWHAQDPAAEPRPVSRAEALEDIAQSRGWANWSTMRAALSGPGLPYAKHNAVEADLYHFYGLDTQDPDVVISRIQKDWGYASREIFGVLITACVHTTFAVHAARGVCVGVDALRKSAYYGSGTGVDFLLRVVHTGEVEGPHKEALFSYIREIPGFSVEAALASLPQTKNTAEHLGYYALGMSKVVGRVDNARREGVFRADA